MEITEFSYDKHVRKERLAFVNCKKVSCTEINGHPSSEKKTKESFVE